MKTATRRKAKAMLKAPTSYLRLASKFAPRPIANDREYDAAVTMMEKLAVREEDDLDQGELYYLDAISEFIAAYDRRHFQFDDEQTPLERLKYVLKESETTPAALKEILQCSQPLVSMILSGSRELSKENIRALAAHFKLKPGAFL